MNRIAILAVISLVFAARALAAPAPGSAQAQPAPPEKPTAVPGADLAGLLSEIDAAYARRDEPEQLARQKEKLAEAEKIAPNDFGVLWRAARLNVWLADDPKIEGKEKSRLGKIAWDYGDRASAADPSRAEGWYWSAAGMGLYGLGIGVITALKQGIEGKFKDRLSRAEKIDQDYNHGGIPVAWGRFYYELPWPKYDPGKSEEKLMAALRKNPDNVRAHVYLADTFAKENRGPEAAEQLRAAMAKPPDQYDPPEERRWQAEAKRKLAQQVTVKRGRE